ncbi:MAG: right-handed parallel beta-helix repeat-containing protein [Anaerolineae bacterium]|nr:right-handed parallel beta-helix repeat-containing protein [Anaerolineae bacterium]
MFSKMRWALIIVVLLLISGSLAYAQSNTYYVARNGRDSNPGTEAKPFRSIRHGMQMLQPGDTLLVKKGTYAEELRNIPSGDSWSNPVTIRAYPGNRVTIKPPKNSERVITFSGNQQYIIIDGFVLDARRVRYEAIKFGGVDDPNQPSPHHIRIINNEIRNAGRTIKAKGQYHYFTAGIFATGNANYLEYIHNVIHHNGVTDFDHGIYQRSSYGLIEGNIIYSNKGSGIKVGWDGNAVNNIVRNNIIYNNSTARGKLGQKKQGRGIGVYAGSGTLVYNNVIWGNHLIGIDVTYGGHSARVFNNTVSSSRGWGIAVGYGVLGAQTSNNTIVRNNIVYQRANNAAIYDFRGVNTLIENNLTYGRNTQIGKDGTSSAVIRNNLEGINPNFMNAKGNDYRLRQGSPAIDVGAALSDVLTDMIGNARPYGSGYDLGAYEYVGG